MATTTTTTIMMMSIMCIAGAQRFRSPFHCVRHVYAVGGARMLFYGAKITVLREAPSFAIYMLTFASLRRYLAGPSSRADPPLSVDLIAGGVAGLMSWGLTIPVDVVKSRLQSDCPAVVGASVEPGQPGVAHQRYSGAVDCVVRSWRAEGLSVFLRGMMVTCMRAFPTNAVILVVYVNAMRFLDA